MRELRLERGRQTTTPSRTSEARSGSRWRQERLSRCGSVAKARRGGALRRNGPPRPRKTLTAIGTMPPRPHAVPQAQDAAAGRRSALGDISNAAPTRAGPDGKVRQSTSCAQWAACTPLCSMGLFSPCCPPHRCTRCLPRRPTAGKRRQPPQPAPGRSPATSSNCYSTPRPSRTPRSLTACSIQVGAHGPQGELLRRAAPAGAASAGQRV